MPKEAADTPLAEFAPKLSELTKNVLFGDVWERPELAKRDRSLITVAALIALNRPDSSFSLGQGSGKWPHTGNLSQTITHLAFYSGWPTAMNAIKVAQEVFAEPGTRLGEPSAATAR